LACPPRIPADPSLLGRSRFLSILHPLRRPLFAPDIVAVAAGPDLPEEVHVCVSMTAQLMRGESVSHL